MFGYSGEEIIWQVPLITPRIDTDETSAILARIKAGQHIDHVETVRIRKTEPRSRSSITVSPIHDADGAIVSASMMPAT